MTKRYRVWMIPQIPMQPFRVRVESPLEGRLVYDALADYDLFQFRHNIKPDYSSVGGLEVFEDGEWIEWNDEDGRDIRECELSHLRTKEPTP